MTISRGVRLFVPAVALLLAVTSGTAGNTTADSTMSMDPDTAYVTLLVDGMMKSRSGAT